MFVEILKCLETTLTKIPRMFNHVSSTDIMRKCPLIVMHYQYLTYSISWFKNGLIELTHFESFTRFTSFHKIIRNNKIGYI